MATRTFEIVSNEYRAIPAPPGQRFFASVFRGVTIQFVIVDANEDGTFTTPDVITPGHQQTAFTANPSVNQRVFVRSESGLQPTVVVYTPESATS